MNFPKEAGTLHVFDKLESEVRSYCRSFKAVFDKARNAKVWDVKGNEYIDFFAGAGALNYGHNNPAIRHKLIGYMLDDGVTHSLDMATKAKETFLTRFNNSILKPRGLDYKIMFPGPTGTNSVESALKIARKATGRSNIICFTNAFHGMSLGSLAATGNTFKRKGAGVDLPNTTFMPYDGYLGERIDTAEILAKLLGDPGSGIDLPAAVILETVQGEGGLNVAGFAWLRRIEALCRKHDILLIVDDVQMGCGRTGSFFSFEGSGIQPDIVCLSKSIGGYGLPLALTLIKPEYDLWSPGEHNGTFRGNNLGFVAASEALSYWEEDTFKIELAGKIRRIHNALVQLLADHPHVDAHIKGRGMIQGISFGKPELAARLSATAFKNGVIMETSGPYDEVAKLMPPLTIEPSVLEQGLAIIKKSFEEVVKAEPIEAIV